MTASPRFPAGTRCPPVSGQKSLHTPLISDLSSPSLPTSLPVCTVNLCSTPHSSLVRYHFLITCVSFFLFSIPSRFVFSPPFTLFTLREVSLPPPLPPPMGKTSICFRGRNRGKQLVDRNIPPSFLPPSLPPLPLHRDLCCLDASE